MSVDLRPRPRPSAPAMAVSSFGELSGLPSGLSEADCRAAVAEIVGAVAVQCHHCSKWFGTRDARRAFCSRQCRLAKSARRQRDKRARRRDRGGAQ